MSGEIRIGTSGWSYDHWDGAFYPEEVPRRRWLEHYVARFPTVEVNASFYRLPPETAIRRWHDAAPDRFRFALKGSRLVTHVRRLSDCEREVAALVERARGLKSFLAAILWQLPPDLERDVELLEGFLRLLPGGARHAIEFRHRSWLADKVLDLLERFGAAAVSVSSQRMPDELVVTTDLVYVRFHGLAGGYEHDYTRAELEPWAERLRRAAAEGRDALAYFNNDARGLAPKNALELVGLLGANALPWGS